MIKQARAALILTSGILLGACGGRGGVSAPTGGTSALPAPTYSISGRVQKGPFSIGSQVVANQLNGALAANGKTYSTQTASDLGVFTFPSTIGSELVELVADGFYMDELTGQLIRHPEFCFVRLLT